MENKTSFDRTQIIGLVLIGLIFAYFAYTSSDTPETAIPEENVIEEVVTPESNSASTSVDTSMMATEEPDSNAVVEKREPKSFTIENDVLTISFSDLGAQMTEARLKEYQTYDSLPLYLVKQNQSIAVGFDNWNSANAWFEVSERTASSLALTTQTPNGPITLRWALRPTEYMVDFTINGESSQPANLGFLWNQKALQHEKTLDLENQKTSISYWSVEEDDMESLSTSSDDQEVGGNVRWIANKQQFFSSILTSSTRFDSARMSVVVLDQAGFTKELQSSIALQTVNGSYSLPMTWYMGPNKYEVLKGYDMGYGQIIDFGWGIFGWISRGVVVKVFNWLDGYGLNYGIIILIMALMIKIVLSPLTFSSYKSMAKMRVLKPEIDELNEEYKDKEPVKKQQAMMELYRKAGVNPLGGCIPQLLQFPILIAMFRFFPASIELRQQSFLWATDLSSFDTIATLPFEIPFYGSHVSLFTILMAISTFMYSYMNQQMTGTNSQMPQMKVIIYIMPFMLLFFFNNYPAGLSYYYLLSNLITFGQQFAIRAFIDDEAIHAKLQSNKEKPKKQSKFSKRLNAAMEQQQSQQDGNRRMRRMK